MASNYKLSYNVDLVFCIDCTETMDNILNIVKQRALSFYDDVQKTMHEKGKEIDQLRVRLVAFRDYLAYAEELKIKVRTNEPMLVSDFFVLPNDAHKLEISVNSLQPIGGGDDDEDGLEALAYAIRSDWTTKGSKDRHIIVLWTDAAPHKLGFGKDAPSWASRYPKGMAADLDELTQWWGDKYDPGFMPEQAAKRLILFAPNKGGWATIAQNWDNVIHFPSNAGDGLKDVDYQTILSCIAQTIG